MSEEKKGMLAAGVAYTIFGLSYLFSKMALEVAEPAILLCARFSVTLIALNILTATGVLKLNLRGKSLVGPILLGLLQPALYFVLENYGLKYTSTSFTGMVSSVSPVFSAVLGAVLLRERPNVKQWVAILVTIAGVMLVSLGGGGGQNTLLGCLCLLGAYFSGAYYTILVRRLTKTYTPFELTYVMFTVGFVFFAALAVIQYRGGTFAALGAALSHPNFIVSIVYLGAVASVGAYLLSNYSLSRLPVARSTIFTSLSTVVSVLSGIVIMKDPFTPVSLLAFALILLGVWGVNFFAEGEKG